MIVRLTDVKSMLAMGAVRVVVLATVVVENYACSELEVQFGVPTERFGFGGTTLPRMPFPSQHFRADTSAHGIFPHNTCTEVSARKCCGRKCR